MAEKGIIVADAASGESIATRDAFEQDDGSNARVIQRVDICRGRLITPVTAIRTFSSGASDGNLNLNSLPADLTANLIDAGDKGSFAFWIEWSSGNANTITCYIVYFASDGTTVIGVSNAINFNFSSSTPIRGTASSDPHVSELKLIDIPGAAKIGVSVFNNPDSYANLSVFGGVI